MNTSELVTKLAEAHSVSKTQTKAIVDDVLKRIVEATASGAEVRCPDSASSRSRRRQNAKVATRQMARRSRLPRQGS